MAETTHTGLDTLADMELDELCYWSDQGRRYLAAKAEAIREQMADER